MARAKSSGHEGNPGSEAVGGDQVEGRRAVLELLRAGRRTVRRVHISRTAERDPVIDEIIERAGRSVDFVPAERIASLARSDAPQGVVASAAPLRAIEVDDVLSADRAFVIALDGVTDPHNLGAIMRSAASAGATGVVVPRHRSARFTPTVMKAAAGAAEYLPIATVAGVPSALERARRTGVWTVGLDERGSSSLFDLALAEEPLVIVIGAEGRGLARLTRERCDVLVRIPMAGNIASLNVSAAATLACFEVARRRSAATQQ